MVTMVSLREAMLAGAAEVLETMAFMALEEADEAANGCEDMTLLGSITFKGGIEGCLGICCGVDCARTMAANMLGTDPSELPESDVNDAVGEIANMVMGAIKSRVQDHIGNMEVSIPSVVQGRQMKHSLGETAQEVSATVSIEEEYFARLSLLYREAEQE